MTILAAKMNELTLPAVASTGWRRHLLTAYFALFAAAGVVALVAPSKAVQYAVPPWATYVWAIFYVIGGTLCLAGVAVRSKAGEIVGLPLIGAASALYGASLLIQFGQVNLDGGYLTVGALLIGQACNLTHRWFYAMRAFNVTQGVAENGC
jgi:hypothetical protein